MVRRSERAASAAPGKKSVGGARARSRRVHTRDDDHGGVDNNMDVQRFGVLKLNNPLIPPELDEDIDDDLAFNSDDEEKYGQFFTPSVKPGSTGVSQPKSKKGKKKSGKAVADGGDADEALVLQQLRALGEIDGEEDLDFHEGGCDDDDFVDLADMLDTAQEEVEDSRKSENGKRKKKKKVDEDGVAKKRRRARGTEEVESIYGPVAVDSGYNTAFREIVAATPPSSTRSRLQQSLANKHNLISVDVDDHVKDATLRSKVREVVAADLEKYKSFLREQQKMKHLQLPMPLPDSNPVPSTLGAVAATAAARFAADDDGGEGDAENDVSAGSAAGKGSNATRASAFRLAGRMNALLTSAGLSTSQHHTSHADDDDVVLLDDNEDDDGAQGGNTAWRGPDGAPTTSYMAKLKAMLSYENARRRRLNRIKSKTYRRILRKENEREKERREKAFELLHPEKARARLSEKLMKARAEERATLKHKNTSKWVRHAKRFAQFDGSTKDAIDEQHLLHQRLMQKMEEDADEDTYLNADGVNRASSEAASSEEERVVDYIIAEASGKQKKQQHLHVDEENNGLGKEKKLTSLLWRSIDDDDAAVEGAVPLMTPMEKARLELRGMKFMQQAKQREEEHYAEVLEQLQEDIRRVERDDRKDLERKDLPNINDSCPNTVASKKHRQSSGATSTNVGRKVFQQKKAGEVVESIHLKRCRGIDAEVGSTTEEATGIDAGGVAPEDGGDMWSIKDDNSSEADDNNNNNDNNKNNRNEMAAAAVVASKPQKVEAQVDVNLTFAGDRKPNAPQIGVVVADNALTTMRKKVSSTRVTILPRDAKRTRIEGVGGGGDDDDDNNNNNAKSEVRRARRENHNEVDAMTQQQQQQEYLIARAFAQDEVDAEFLAEKTAQVETIMKPVDKNATLPGWGEWGGTDLRLNKRHRAKLQEMEVLRNIEKTTLLKSRADAALDHVIINHDGVELVPDRMLLHMIPRPFSNPTEFARSMRHPHGPEWNSAVGFKDANQPRVEVRQGQAVLPLDLSLRGKKKAAKTRRRKAVAVV